MGNDILAGLNPQQQEAVKHKEGPMLVLAGAGSGKTRVLTRRVANLIDHYNVLSTRILAVTFTNKAADEMKERVEKLVGDLETLPLVSTFHSFCVRVLRVNARELGYDNNFVIYDTSDQKSLIKEVMKDINIDYQKTRPSAVMGEISRAKNKLITPEEYGQKLKNFFQKLVSRIYPVYQQRLQDNNALDFADLIMKTVQLWEENSAILTGYRQRFQYLLIDEYQDVNFAQYRLGKLLAGEEGNIFVVGDPDQSIYGFRGADINNILNFEDDFPQARVIKLERNYRSRANILEAAHNVIRNNEFRPEKKLWTDRESGQALKKYVGTDGREEAAYICREIKKLKSSGDYDYRDMVVLYRTNAQSRIFEEILLRYSLPYQIIGGVRFYDRMEIKDILAYLRLIYNPADDISFLRVINKPRRGIGEKTVTALQKYARENDVSLYRAGLEVEDNPHLSAGYKKRVKNFINLVEEFRVKQEKLALSKLVDRLLVRSGYKKYINNLDRKESRERQENIRELYNVINKHMKNNDNNTLQGFLEEVSLLADIDDLEEGEQHITLMTLHAAKGLEFPVVFLAGMEEGIFPHTHALDQEDGIEEERRLCYVGITRAEDELYLTRARTRMRYGEKKNYPPSRFLDEIPDQLFGVKSPEKKETRETETSPPSSARYRPGQKVVHPRWGVGEIQEVKDNRGLELLIDFGGGNLRNLLAEYAPLQRYSN
ncbi:MAG: ATP-dependent helicase [Halanaerobiales bacterium]